MTFQDFEHKISPAIRAIIAYGSQARGDFDAASDWDACVVFNGVTRSDANVLASNTLCSLGIKDCDISLYEYKEFLHMLNSGSLFGWHLSLEGRTLFCRDHTLQAALAFPAPYCRAREDIRDYDTLARDVKESILKNGVNEYDLALLFTVARNTAMVLSFVCGQPAFGRSSVFASMTASSGIVLDRSVWATLMSWKLWHVRGIECPGPLPEQGAALQMLKAVENLLTEAELVVRNYVN